MPSDPTSPTVRYTTADTALGRLLVAATARGLCDVRFGPDEFGPDESRGSGVDADLRAGLAAELPGAVLERDDAGLAGPGARIAAAAAGSGAPLDLPLDVRGSRFERRVWSALRRIPTGATCTYGDVARTLGALRGARAVARACARNPVAVVVPCHRVVPAAGGAGGYRWGAGRKRALLAAEARAGSATAAGPDAADGRRAGGPQEGRRRTR